MVSGKGGVGKTSLSAALAVRLASEGHTTLIVSTDPAHSLSDSLAQDVSGGKPVPVEGTDLPLWGMEVNPNAAIADFRASSATNNTGEKAVDFMRGMGLGIIADQLADLKLGELLNTPPPGLDEAVSIAKVVEFVRGEEYARFSRIVFDTAPTGHTLRLLALPTFVEASLGKIIRLRKKLSGATAAVRALFGAGEAQDEVVAKLEKLQADVAMVRSLFRDADQTEFIIATIPTVLGLSESSRLLGALRADRIPCQRMVVNQVLGPGAGATAVALKLKDQSAALRMLRSDARVAGLRLLEAPLVDVEVRGVPALAYFGRVAWGDTFDRMNQGTGRKYFMLGGKGGVGKTSCSSALAVRCAQEGLPTLIVSTDPAHSLSDAFEQDLRGGLPVKVDNPLGGELPLWGMQIDLEQAKAELKEVTRSGGAQSFNDFLDGLGLGIISSQLRDLDLGELMDTPPPGVDEAIAISKVVQFLQSSDYAHFQRVIFDTAPTGHTLRLLSLPDFLDASIGKIVRLRQKLTQAAANVKSFITGSKAEEDPAVVKLEELRTRMEEARQLFRDAERTEFVIVTIPTVMAAAESVRLAQSLHDEHIPLHTILINQVMQDGTSDKFLERRRADQQRALEMVKSDPGLSKLQVIYAPLLDLEVRGVPALQYFGNVVWR